MDLAGQDLSRTLLLVLGRLLHYRCVVLVNRLKNAREVVPGEFWAGLEQEIGPFPDRVAELIKALSGDHVPSFKELLKVFCGGSLLQECYNCNTSVTVAAVVGEVEGIYLHVPLVALMPYLPPLFSCGASTCMQEIAVKGKSFFKWRYGLVGTFVKLRPNKCDFCFKLPLKVHRFEERLPFASGV